jgi:hypothetical protein
MSKPNDFNLNLNIELLSTSDNEENTNINLSIFQEKNEASKEYNDNFNLDENYNNEDEDKIYAIYNSNQIENDKEKENVNKKFLKKKTKKNIKIKSVIDIKNAFDKEEEKLEKQYCNKKTNVIKFTKRLRKKFKTYFYRKKSIKSFENNMIDFNKEIYDNNENNEFISQNSDYRNLGSLSLSTGDDEISLSEERTNISVNNGECDYYQNQNFLSYYCLFSNYPCDK